jgi:hypothetical protein
MVAGLANCAIFGFIVCAAFLIAYDPDLYNRSVQEDEVLEWMTFWSFVGAAGVHGANAIRAIQRRDRMPWFFAGLAAFCLLVALEEISWGQRLLGYRPPDYFLAENYQQELNLHNTLGDALRQNGFLLVCWGYGVGLALLGAWPSTLRLLGRFGISPPPLELLPGFAATALFYQIYPWSHTGEWAEAMLGLAMLFVALLQRRGADDSIARSGVVMRILVSWLLTASLGAATARIGWLLTAEDAGRLERARVELAALREDIAAAQTRTRCGIHKRIFTMVEAYQMDHLFDGEFASLQASGLPEDRAHFFMDPWNSPYWVHHGCSEDRRRRAIFVYSFGPDRRRDSTDWEILGDDLGAWISRPRNPADD